MVQMTRLKTVMGLYLHSWTLNSSVWIRITLLRIRIRIRLITLMRIRILIFLFDADPDPTFHLDADPERNQILGSNRWKSFK
jgi:hypothetical protein